MKPKKNVILLASLGVCALVEINAFAQFSADIATFDIANPDMFGTTELPLGPRIFNDSGFTVRQAESSVVWFVASVDNSFNMDGTLGMDDTLVYSTYVGADGTGGFLAGNLLGGYLIENTPIGSNPLSNIPAAIGSQNIGVFAFDVIVAPNNINSFTPTSGDTFGFLNLGVNTPPPLGNAQWFIDDNIWTGQFVVGVIPEPSTYALLALGGLGAFAYRRFRRE